MDKEDKLTLNNKEQMDIMTDPFALEIISVMTRDDVVTKQSVAEELGEDLTLISEYIDSMVENNFVIIIDEAEYDDKAYRMAAKSIHSSSDLVFSKDMKDIWISGFINHLENSIVDFFDYMIDVEGDKREHLEEKGFYKDILTDFSPVYLSPEEVDEVHEFFKKYLSEKINKKRKDDDQYKPYYLFNFLFPNIKKKKE
jgi:hypothetical protein